MTSIQLLTGNALDILKGMESESINLVITSPPYFGLRKYSDSNDEIGREQTPKEYLDNLINVFSECKRVLTKDGSIWVNIADSYAGSSRAGGDYNKGGLREGQPKYKPSKSHNIPHKSLIGIPERFIIRMQDELHLIRRNTIIWQKGNVMPSSAKDRFTIDFEYFYFFTKSPKYFFNTQYEPMKYQYKSLKYNGQDTKDYESANAQSPSNSKRRILESYKKQAIKFGGNKYPNNVNNATYSGNIWKPNEQLMRIKRTVWSINSANYKQAHFAVFPSKLVESPILACSNEGDTVLDPFMGSGTTGLVASQLGRHFIGIDLQEDYISMARERIKTGK